MCFVQELICCHTILINIFGKRYENNYCKTALNRIFDVEISQIRVLNSKISLIFELLNFADFLNDLTPAPFLCKREQVKPASGECCRSLNLSAPILKCPSKELQWPNLDEFGLEKKLCPQTKVCPYFFKLTSTFQRIVLLCTV